MREGNAIDAPRTKKVEGRKSLRVARPTTVDALCGASHFVPIFRPLAIACRSHAFVL
jgi:hypothetical protein